VIGSEAALRAIVKRELGPYGKVIRVESPIEPGTPDIAFTLAAGGSGAAGWIELKYLSSWPARETTPVRIPSLTLDQARFAASWEAVEGGRSPLLLQVGREYALFAGREIGTLFLDAPVSRAALVASALVASGPRFPTALILRSLLTPLYNRESEAYRRRSLAIIGEST
jgi:hypothetical protein